MKIAIIGYGKMGHMIEKLCLERQHEVAIIIDKENIVDLQSDAFKSCDVAIDFSIPESAASNILQCFESGVPIVSGTTGWLDRKTEIETKCRELNGSFLYASNFSVGVNVLFALNKQLARMMEKFDNYSCQMEETHHIHKLDAPSGTAITLAEDIIENNKNLRNWELSEDKLENTIPIKAIREGEVTGKHTISYESDVDTISIQHEAKNRRGFALGAVLAAEYIFDKQGIYQMQDILAL